jgi:hypothetical protein
MNDKKCENCRYKITDKERDIVLECKVGNDINNPYLLSAAKNGMCPYHDYQEYYGCK